MVNSRPFRTLFFILFFPFFVHAFSFITTERLSSFDSFALRFFCSTSFILGNTSTDCFGQEVSLADVEMMIQDELSLLSDTPVLSFETVVERVIQPQFIGIPGPQGPQGPKGDQGETVWKEKVSTDNLQAFSGIPQPFWNGLGAYNVPSTSGIPGPTGPPGPAGTTTVIYTVATSSTIVGENLITVATTSTSTTIAFGGAMTQHTNINQGNFDFDFTRNVSNTVSTSTIRMLSTSNLANVVFPSTHSLSGFSMNSFSGIIATTTFLGAPVSNYPVALLGIGHQASQPSSPYIGGLVSDLDSNAASTSFALEKGRFVVESKETNNNTRVSVQPTLLSLESSDSASSTNRAIVNLASSSFFGRNAITFNFDTASGSSYTFPVTRGATGTVLTNSGAGLLSWSSVATTSPAGANTQIQYNNAGTFGATSTFVWDNTNGRLGIGTSSPTRTLSIIGDIFASSTATSTFTGSMNVQGHLQIGTSSIYLRSQATSTFDGGINILGSTGCFAINGVCISGGGGSGWSLTGNSGTNPNVNFLGTIDAQDLIFKTANVTTGRITNDGTGIMFGTSAGLNGSNLYVNYFGSNAGEEAANAFYSNFLGNEAGYFATDASNSNFLGRRAGSGATNANFSNFLGTDAGNGASLANNSNFFGQAAGLNANNANNSNFFGQNAGNAAGNADNSNFFGQAAGQNASNALNSNFLGSSAGSGASSAQNSNFFGQNAGQNASNATNGNFFGQNAGSGAISAIHANFFGSSAGQNASNASNSNFLGELAGSGATNASFSNFFGQNSGQNASGARRAIFIGSQSGQNDTVDNTVGVASTSILIGNNTNTSGFSDSIAIGAYTTNSAARQLNLGNSIFATNIHIGPTQSATPVASSFVGIGTSTPATKLQVFGDARVGNAGTNGCLQRYDGASLAGTCTSDKNLKTDVVYLESMFEKVIALKPSTYSWNETAIEKYKYVGDTRITGLVAQDVEAVFPHLVSINDEGFRVVDSQPLVYYVVAALKELNQKLGDISTEDSFFLETFIVSDIWKRITQAFEYFGVTISRGLVMVQDMIAERLFVEEIKTEKLCVGNICVTEAEFLTLLQNTGTQGQAPSVEKAGGVDMQTEIDSPMITRDLSQETNQEEPSAKSAVVELETPPYEPTPTNNKSQYNTDLNTPIDDTLTSTVD